MPNYFVNKNTDAQGDHEVHTEDCPWIPEMKNRIALGYHANCKSAVKKAKEYYSKVNGHKYCSVDCHTT
jgi:hypothetical protein